MRYIRTYSGGKLFTTPRPCQVELEDIATALSRVPRFGGHSYHQYSVAAHCIRVSFMVPPPLQLQALFHDASEAYIADIPSPFKRLMPDYKRIERRIMEAVAKKFGFDWPKDPIVKQADAAALYEERRRLFRTLLGQDDLIIPFVEAPYPSKVWGYQEWSLLEPQKLAERFIERAEFLLSI